MSTRKLNRTLHENKGYFTVSSEHNPDIKYKVKDRDFLTLDDKALKKAQALKGSTENLSISEYLDKVGHKEENVSISMPVDMLDKSTIEKEKKKAEEANKKLAALISIAEIFTEESLNTYGGYMGSGVEEEEGDKTRPSRVLQHDLAAHLAEKLPANLVSSKLLGDSVNNAVPIVARNYLSLIMVPYIFLRGEEGLQGANLEKDTELFREISFIPDNAGPVRELLRDLSAELKELKTFNDFGSRALGSGNKTASHYCDSPLTRLSDSMKCYDMQYKKIIGLMRVVSEIGWQAYFTEDLKNFLEGKGITRESRKGLFLKALLADLYLHRDYYTETLTSGIRNPYKRSGYDLEPTNIRATPELEAAEELLRDEEESLARAALVLLEVDYSMPTLLLPTVLSRKSLIAPEK